MDRAVHLLVRALSAVVRLLPLRMCVAIGRMLGKAGCVLLPGYRRLALRNLRIAFPEMPARELRALAREHFATLGGNLFANPKIASMSPDELRGIVEIEGAELAEKLVAEKRGIVVVISHIGNWELFAQLWPIVFKCPSGTIYQRLGNPHMDADMRASRARLGLKLFERKEGFQGAVALLREGGSVGVLVDQHAGDAGVWAPFFGRLASTSPLAATLALRTGAALVPAAVYSDAPGRWRMVIQPPLEPATRDTDTITAKINDTLETQIRRQPADWFWVHNRWKTPRPKFLLAGYKRGVVGNLGFRISDFGFGEGASDVRNRPENQKSEIRIQKSLQPFRILIRASNWLGDAVMSVPAVRAIKAGRPDAHVTILTPAKLADFWKSVPEVDATIAIERGESVFTVARSIRADFEAAIIFPNSLRAALEPWLAGIPRRVGFPGHRRAWLLHQIFRPKKKKSPEAPRHQVGHYLALAEFCGAVAGVRTSTFDVRRSTFDVFPSLA